MSSTGWPNNLTFVDDLDSRIQYSAGWQAVTGGAEVDGTKHGADNAGMTATFDFTGTFVSVVGSLGSVDVYGIPSTTYAIDGTAVGTYTAPVLDPGLFRPNETFFNSPTLDAASHTLVITNANGTSPNVFWLDHILFAASTPPSPASSTITSSTTTSTNTQPSSSVPHKSNDGAIVGGVIGGIGGLALLAGLLLWWLSRRRRCAHPCAPVENSGKAHSDIRPFDAWARTEPLNPHRPTLPPAPASYATMAESTLGPRSVLLRATRPDFSDQHRPDSSPAFLVDDPKDALVAAAVERGESDRRSSAELTAPPPYMQ